VAIACKNNDFGLEPREAAFDSSSEKGSNKKSKDAQLGTRGQSARGRSPAAWKGTEGGLQHSLRIQKDKTRRFDFSCFYYWKQ